jgi:hypothetical protein
MTASQQSTAALTVTRAAQSAASSTRAKLLIIRNIAELRHVKPVAWP